MPPVIDDRYGGGQRNVGTPAIVDLLHGWFGTRYAMNQAAMAQDGGRDADKLAEMELAAREGLGKLERALTEARSGDTRSYNDLVGTVIKTKGGMAEANAKAQADMAKQKLWFRSKWMDKADAEAAKVAAGSAYSDTAKEIVGNLGAGVASMPGDASARGKRAAEQVRSLAQAERAGGFGDLKYDALVRDAYSSLIRAGQADAAAALARELQPNAEEDPNEFFVRRHTPMGPQEADEYAKKITREYGAGVSTGEVDKWLLGMGIEPSEIGMPGEDVETSVRESATGGAGAGEARPATGGSVRVSGLGAEAADVLVQARNRGEDPYAAMLLAIQKQAAFADSLAAERKAAAEKRRSVYPMANPFVSTPNTYVSDEGRAAARRVGQNDPGLNKAWAGALEAEDGNVRRAYDNLREDGGAQPRYTAKDFRADDFEEGGNLGGALAGMLAESVDVEDPDGKWAYRLNPDLTIAITKAPNKGAVGTVVRRGTKEWDAIMGVAGDKAPLTKLATIIGSQPAEVQALFADAWAMATKGDPKAAAELAAEVDADAVRAAYGQAMQRAEDRPEEIEAIRIGLDALPEDVKAGWSAPFYDVLDEYGRNQHTGGYLAAGATRGSVGALGRALEGSRGTAQRRRALEHVEGAENKADVRERGFYDQGRDLAIKALGEARDDWERMEVRRGWESTHRNAPSDLTRGAIAALDVADRRGTDAAKGGERITKATIESAPIDVVGKTPAHAEFSRTPTTIVEQQDAKRREPAPDFDDFDTFTPATEGTADFADFDSYEAP